MNDILYLFIKKEEVTPALLNRAITKNLESLPVYKVSSGWWIFSVDTEYVVIEFFSSETKITTAFDPYTWLTEAQVLAKIQEYNSL